ncbi:MAG: dihydroxy-acid dehydratase, partial [Ramlibacter sp.]
VRGLYAEGKVGRDELLAAENAAYHGPGTCTFYGTANSNQMLMEMMGLHVPGSAFVHPGTDLRDALVKDAARRVVAIGLKGDEFIPIGRMVDEKAVVKGVVGLMATGGSTNHALHLIAMARAAGVELALEDLDEISRATPLLARVYPNGSADVNQFQAAGGPGYVIRELLDAGLMHEDVRTVRAGGIREYTGEPAVDGKGGLRWTPIGASRDAQVVRPVAEPFSATGGLKLLTGNIGRAVIKVSAVPQDRHVIEAPARIFNAQEELLKAFNDGELEKDLIAVVRWQGPQANGMPELHKLTPPLAVLQGRGFKVALVTDGRMSGASGKVPAAIHVSPEAAAGGALAKLRDGDMVRLDADAGTLTTLVPESEWAARVPATMPEQLRKANGQGMGRDLFAGFRRSALTAEEGACTWL